MHLALCTPLSKCLAPTLERDLASKVNSPGRHLCLQPRGSQPFVARNPPLQLKCPSREEPSAGSAPGAARSHPARLAGRRSRADPPPRRACTCTSPRRRGRAAAARARLSPAGRGTAPAAGCPRPVPPLTLGRLKTGCCCPAHRSMPLLSPARPPGCQDLAALPAPPRPLRLPAPPAPCRRSSLPWSRAVTCQRRLRRPHGCELRRAAGSTVPGSGPGVSASLRGGGCLPRGSRRLRVQPLSHRYFLQARIALLAFPPLPL